MCSSRDRSVVLHYVVTGKLYCMSYIAQQFGYACRYTTGSSVYYSKYIQNGEAICSSQDRSVVLHLLGSYIAWVTLLSSFDMYAGMQRVRLYLSGQQLEWGNNVFLTRPGCSYEICSFIEELLFALQYSAIWIWNAGAQRVTLYTSLDTIGTGKQYVLFTTEV